MGLTVVGLAGSTCTGRVLATLFEKNVEDFEVKPVDFAAGEHKKPEYLKLQVSNQWVLTSIYVSRAAQYLGPLWCSLCSSILCLSIECCPLLYAL